MNIFPGDYNIRKNRNLNTEDNTIPLLKEYAIDFEKEEILIDDKGKFTIVEGLEAVKVRCFLALKIQRNRYLIYLNVGNKLKSLIGKDLDYINRNIKSMLEEALIDEYVKSIEDIKTSQEGNKVTVEFTINTVYGPYEWKESW
ncbi:DUF2634 domain-containing protein [Clostridium botulinum]|uniref:DUF2634 domain-containing protein n=1 Tax=unclassified Clostridium TaxID=2614128 RepID=UPI0013C67D0E|nr:MULTISPECIES: DUF2634 domain-containing protein [unclassified Clostridium]NFM12030.1 DUF2634 domain-containing protein [Clostridium botulinum]NFN78692.1 DUF2634 domain-containing protein [Clostridium botulinum]NFO75755.1 DUF2634 domain-containing protein [Clostridium botulinum]NFO79242.1 DUF2634 domain-containing protein [Clostridium botulinum]NFP05992.1 DUF2634 domain-containing protein [Clostridium botulinum]